MTPGAAGRRARFWISLLLIVAGLGSLAWTATVWLWEDPLTALYTAQRQRSLANSLDERVRAWHDRAPGSEAPTLAQGGGDESTRPPRPNRLALDDVRRAARAYRVESEPGDAIARLRIPRLGVSEVVVNGTGTSDLRAGPGRHLRTAMPGERRLVYIAGHRTTFGAPFAHIDRLAPGDEVRVTLPYATMVYRVTGHTIVDDNDLSVLAPGKSERLALQACHPRFFASHRYIVWARLAEALAPTGAGSA